jgi:hypothetical protein
MHTTKGRRLRKASNRRHTKKRGGVFGLKNMFKQKDDKYIRELENIIAAEDEKIESNINYPVEDTTKYNCVKPDDQYLYYTTCEKKFLTGEIKNQCEKLKKINNGFVLSCELKAKCFRYLWNQILINREKIKDQMEEIKKNRSYRYLGIGLNGFKKSLFESLTKLIYIQDDKKLLDPPLHFELKIGSKPETPLNSNNLHPFFKYLNKIELEKVNKTFNLMFMNISKNKIIPFIENPFTSEDNEEIIEQTEKDLDEENGDTLFVGKTTLKRGGKHHRLRNYTRSHTKRKSKKLY